MQFVSAVGMLGKKTQAKKISKLRGHFHLQNYYLSSQIYDLRIVRAGCSKLEQGVRS